MRGHEKPTEMTSRNLPADGAMNLYAIVKTRLCGRDSRNVLVRESFENGGLAGVIEAENENTSLQQDFCRRPELRARPLGGEQRSEVPPHCPSS